MKMTKHEKGWGVSITNCTLSVPIQILQSFWGVRALKIFTMHWANRFQNPRKFFWDNLQTCFLNLFLLKSRQLILILLTFYCKNTQIRSLPTAQNKFNFWKRCKKLYSGTLFSLEVKKYAKKIHVWFNIRFEQLSAVQP